MYNPKPKIAIIGAGIAGLTTAYRLHQKGFDTDVYEAKHRIGGRVFTILAGGHVAELGAQNIANAGAAENICKLIGELGLQLIESKKKLVSYYFTGSKFISDRELLKKISFTPESLKVRLADIAAESKNMRDVLNKICKESEPLWKLLSVKLAGWEGACVEKLSPWYTETLYHMLLGGMSSSQTNKDSEGLFTHWSIAGGNSFLPIKLAQALGNKVHTGMPLKLIAKDTNGYILNFGNGSTTLADIVVLAIPCSVYGNIVFKEGVISEKQLLAIKQVAYGTNSKILVPLNKMFQDKGELIDDCIIIFPNADQTVLNLYYTGDAGLFSANTITQAYSQEQTLLEAGFGKASMTSVKPVLARDELWAAYQGPVGHSWPNDPYVRGSYSYIAPGQENVFTSLHEHVGEITKTLFAPVNNTLYFAGEHASILMDVPGTMEAACESGERVARMVKNHWII